MVCTLGAALALAAGSLAVEALVRARLDDSLWRATARFYARSPVLQVGTRVDPGALARSLERLGYRRTNRRDVGIGEYQFDGFSWTIGRRAFPTPEGTDPGGIAIVYLDDRGWVSRLADGDDRWLSSVALEPEPLRPPGPPGDDRLPVRLADVPPSLVDAVLAVEDQHFFQHNGVDLGRIGGAALANLRAAGVAEGGSTITQQLVKNLFLSPRRIPTRKLRELAIALVLEWRYSKEEILEAYLNEVYLGQDGAYAVRGGRRGSTSARTCGSSRFLSRRS